MAKSAPEAVLNLETLRRNYTLRAQINPPKAGEEVVIKGNFLASEETDQWAGFDDAHIMPMAVASNIATVDLTDVEVGRTYEFSIGYRDTTDPSKIRWTTKMTPDGKGINHKVKIPAEAEKSPSPTAPRANVHNFVKAEVGKILEAGGSRSKATSLEVLFRTLETQLRGTYGVREDVSTMMLAAAVEAIRERKQLPVEVKNQFTDANPPATFDELDSRLDAGARLYREVVFARILGDPDAREFFNLDINADYDDSNPLGSDTANEAFVRICNSKCLGGFANVLGECLKRTADLSVVDPALAGERRALLTGVIGRLPDDQRTALAKVVDSIPAGRKAKWGDVMANGGLTGFAALIDPTFGIGTLALKATLEGLTGVSLSDVLKARTTGDYGPLKDALLNNNIAVHTLKAEGGFLGRLKEMFGRAIPIYGMKYAGKSVGNYKPGEGQPEAQDKPKQLPAKRDASSFITKACDAAILK